MPLLDSLRWLSAAIPYPLLMPRKPIGRMDQIAQLARLDPDAKAGEQAEACANAACGGPRVEHGARHGAHEWRRLEGHFLCSSACWSSLLGQRIEREFFAWKVSQAATHSHRVPLGLLLLSLGWITEEQLHTAVEAQRKGKQGRIGEWLRRQTALTEKEITRALAMQWNCPIFDLEAYRPQAAGIPRELMESCRILPLPARGRSVLFLAFENGVDAVVSYAVQHITGMRVEAGLAAEGAFRNAWTRSLALESRAAATSAIETSGELYHAAASVLGEPGVVDTRLVRLHQHFWLRALYAPRDRGGAPPYRDYLYRLPARASTSLLQA